MAMAEFDNVDEDLEAVLADFVDALSSIFMDTYE